MTVDAVSAAKTDGGETARLETLLSVNHPGVTFGALAPTLPGMFLYLF